MLAALGGDHALFDLVREDLIFEDLVEDKKGVGLIYIGPADAPVEEGAAAVMKPTEAPASARSQHIFLHCGRKDDQELAFRLQQALQAPPPCFLG